MEEVEIRHHERTVGPPVFIVSGGVGASGEQLVRTALAQFVGVHVPVEIVSHVTDLEAVERVVNIAAARRGMILHTLVDGTLRDQLTHLADEKEVIAIDAMGPLLDHLARVLNQEPVGRPGLYRQLYSAYFKRVDAIEFAVAHDDGKRVEDLARADIVLTGVSRVGKTPVSIYLSMLGWKVANVPLALELTPPPELLAVDRRRVVALTLQPQQLLLHRRARLATMGIAPGAYVEIESVVEELRAAQHLYARQGFAVVDMTDKPIETAAEEVLARLTV